MLEQEETIWKQILGLEGRYEINEYGEIRNWVSRKSRKPQINRSTGYYHFSYWEKSKLRTIDVHRLVAINFLGDPKGRVVNHKDGNKTNNHVSNLEYITLGENTLHAFRTGLVITGLTSKKARFMKRDIQQRASELINQLASEYNMKPKTIRAVLRGKAWSRIEPEQPRSRQVSEAKGL